MQTVDPGTEIAARSASLDLQQARPTEGALAKAARVTVGVVGVGMMGTALLGVLGVFLNAAKDPVGTLVGVSIVMLAFGGAGFALARAGFRRRRAAVAPAAAPPATSPRLELAIKRRMLAVASQFGGRLTAAELAAALMIEEAPAARALEAAAQAGEARMLFAPEGIAVYEFPGLVAHKAEAKEPWEL
jgi:hypothetical protein